MSMPVYFPVLKTRDAELKAISKLDDLTFDSTLPIYELTKSRKAITAPDGDIHKRMKSIKEIQKDRPFILDLSTNEKYMNPQIEQLLSPTNGFYEWRYFINMYNSLNLIPMIHIYDEDDFTEVEIFLKELADKFRKFAIRFPYDIKNIDSYVSSVIKFMAKNSELYVIIDAGQITGDIESIKETINTRFHEIDKLKNKTITPILVSSFFPKSVSLFGDKEGTFPILEEDLYKSIPDKFNVKYGDYASINLEQIEMKGGTFVPRIDISLKESFIYHRYRRASGGYISCAMAMKADKRYKSIKPIESWADKEISLAESKMPSGISPSYWIAVRMNYFMASRVRLRLGI